MAKQIVFDKDAFVGKVRSDVITLESKVEKYLADILQKEAKTNVNDDFKNTLAKFKASINVYSTAISTTSTKVSFPEEVYKVLLAGHAVKYAPQIKKIDGTLIKEMEAYIADILGTGKTVTTADGESYKVDTTLDTAGLATVTYKGRLYTLTWRSDSAKNSLYSLLGSLKTWGQNFESYFFNELKKDALDALLGTWVKALLSKNKYIAEEVYDSFKNFLDAGGDATNIPLLANDNFSKWLSDLTKKRFPDTNKEIAALQKKYKTLDDLSKDTALLKDYKAEPDSTADAIKNTVTGLTSYKNFLKAYNDLQTAIGQSTSNFDSIIPNYIGYEISNVVSDTFSENNATITCMDGNNNIEITGSNVSVDTGRGNDTIQSGSYSESNSKVKIHSGDGDDEIYNYSSDSTLDGGAGADFIRSDSKGTNVSISGGDGSDTIDSHGNHNIIDGGAGNDSISNYGDNVTISGDGGADTIRSYGSDSSVFGGAGDDELLVMSSYVDGGTGSDTISIQGSYVTAYGGSSFDYLPTKDVFNIASGASNVYINDFEFGDVLNLPAGNYTARIEFGSTAIRNSSGKLIVWLKNFTDRLENFTYDENGKQTSDGDDSINNDVSNIKIDLGAGNDYAYNSGDNVTINGGDGNDSIKNGYYKSYYEKREGGSNVSIDAGEGNNTVYSYHGATVKTEDGNDFVSVYGGGSIDVGEGNNTVYSYSSNTTVKTDAGNDYVSIHGGGLIDVGDGNNTIKVYGYKSVNATVKTDSGNDFISIHGDWKSSSINANVDSGDGNDTIIICGDSHSSVNATVKTGSGDDYVSIHSDFNLLLDANVDLGDGNNTVMFYGNGAKVNATIKTGYGNDYFYVYGGSIDAGEGNNTINGGYNSKATVKTGSGNDYIEDCSSIDAGEGDNTVHAYYDATVKTGSGDDYISGGSSIDAGEGDNTVSGSGTIKTGSGDDFVSIHSGSIDVGEGNNTVYSYYDATVKAGSGDEFVSIRSGSIDVGDGNNTVYGGSTVKTGSGNDYIEDCSSIDAGEGDNTVHAYYDATVKTGSGDDYISNGGSVDAGDGNNTVSGSGTIKTGSGNDYISGGGSIDAGDGDNSVYSNNHDVTITTGAGDDYISGGSSIDAGDGNNIVYGHGMIKTGDGNNTVYGGYNATVRTGDGDDYISGGSSIDAGKGNDLISLNSAVKNNVIEYRAGDGNDTIWGFNSSSTLSISGGEYVRSTVGNDVIITVEDGSILLKDANGKTLNIDGTEVVDEPVWTLSGKIATYGTPGNTLVTVSGVKSLEGLYLSGNTVTISEAALGTDTVSISSGYSLALAQGVDTIKEDLYGWTTLSSGNVAYLTGGTGSYYSLSSNGKTITYNAAVTGANQVELSGVKGTPTLDNNFVSLTANNFASDVSLVSNAGGFQFVLSGNFNGKSFTGTNSLLGSTVSDTIHNHGQRISINTGAGDDYLYSYADNVTIDAGEGDDYIYNNGSNVLFNYRAGDGNDSINGFNAISTLSISGGTYSTQQSGNDVIVTVGDGKITLASATSLSALNINGEEQTVSTTLTLDNNSAAKQTLPAQIVTADATKRTSATRIVGNALNNSILGGTGKDTLYGGNGADYLEGGKGNDKLYGQASNDTLDGGIGNDYLSGYTGNDSLNGGAGNDTLLGGTGNDTLTGGAGNDLFVYSAGKDVITDYATGDKISINAAVTASSVKGSDATFTIGSNTLTVKDGKGKEVVFIDAQDTERTIVGGTYLSTDSMKSPVTISSWRQVGDASERTTAIKLTGNSLDNTLLGGSGKDTLYGKDGNDYLVGNDGNDKLYGQVGNDTLIGGAGNDTLTGGDGNDLFVFDAGNDFISDYATDDKISVNAEITASSVVGSNATFTIGSNTLTVKNGKGAEIVFLDADGNERTIIGGAFVATNSTSTKNTLASWREVGDASARTSAIYLVGNVLGNTLLGGSGKDSLYGKDGDDFIQGNAGADSLYGQNGDDTLWGGIGNDTLKGGDGDDLFIYSGGNDVITDYASGDKISLGMAVTSASLKGSDAILTTDGGKLTIKNAKDLTLIDSFGTEMTTIIGSATYDNNATTKVTLPSGIEIGDASSRTTAIKITGNSLDNSILGGVGKDSLYGGKGNDYIQGGDGNDKIWGQDGNDTLSGGAGNDSMSGGNGANLFIYEFGKDYITDFSATDTLQIGDGTGTYSTQVSGSDIIVTVGDGSITLKDAASLSAVNILGEEISPIEIYGKSSAAKVTLASGIEVGDASARTAAIRIVGNALDNTIFGGAGKDTLYGKDGNDYISGSTGNDKLYGQNGNDTLWGGSGNDTFTGGAGADTFIYNSGEGKDVISDFSNDDLLQITGTFSATYDSSANTISFKVGSTASAITLKNFTAASFKVNDDSYLISGSKLVTK